MKTLKWKDIKDGVLTTRIIQAKTGRPVCLTLHSISQSILNRQKQKTGEGEMVFSLPTADGANKVLTSWMKASGIQKHITWSCARLSFSILLQDRNVDDATVAYLMGHTSTEQVQKTYKRHRPKNQMETIGKLPYPETLPHFLNPLN